MRTALPKKRLRPRRKRPNLFHKPARDMKFLDPHSYVTKGGRVRLFGADYEELRGRAYYHAGGICECGCKRRAPHPLMARMTGEIVSIQDMGELSHNEHGARKSDELHRVKWMRHECHMKSHNCGGKPVPAKI